jgi:hypothetical protein
MYVSHLVSPSLPDKPLSGKKVSKKNNNSDAFFLVQGGPVPKSHLFNHMTKTWVGGLFMQMKFSEVLSLTREILGYFKNEPSAD